MSMTAASGRGLAGKAAVYAQPAGEPTAYQDWARPSDWLAMPAMSASDQKFVGLLAIFSSTAGDTYASNYVSFTAAGAYTVDWGDGTSENIATGVQAYHSYSWSSVSAATLTSRGYRQALVTITPQSGQTITSINLQALHSATSVALNYNWLDIAVAGPSMTTFNVASTSRAAVSQVVTFSLLESVRMYSSAIVSQAYNFANASYTSTNGIASLQSVVLDPAAVTSTTTLDYAFAFSSVRSIVLSDLPACTSMQFMFNSSANIRRVVIGRAPVCLNTQYMMEACTNLVEFYAADLSAATSTTYMFDACASLRRVSPLNLKSSTSLAGMFNGCSSLESVVIYNTSKATLASSMFYGCTSLVRAPDIDTSNVGVTNSMFYNCSSLRYVPAYNLSQVYDAASMFFGCSSLKTVPDLDMSSCTTFTNMFYSCKGLVIAPALKMTTKIKYYNSMFYNCKSLQEIPAGFNMSSTGNSDYTNMFSGCSSLISVPGFTATGGANFTGVFYNCYSLRSVGPIDAGAVATTFSSMFFGCRALPSVQITMPSATTADTTFYNCASLTSFSSSAPIATITSMFGYCTSLRDLTLNTYNVPSFTTPFTSCQSLTNVLFTGSSGNGVRAALTLPSSMGLLDLQKFFSSSLNRPSSPPVTLTIGGCPGTLGANAVVSRTSGVTVTSGSTTISMTNTTSVASGSTIYGTGIGGYGNGRSVSFTGGTPGTVSGLSNHGIPNGHLVSFSSITTTTGITTYTPYYVVNATTNTFQLATSPGGSALTLTNSGTGTVFYPNYITGVVTNTNVTTLIPCFASATSANIRTLDMKWAWLRGHSVSG